MKRILLVISLFTLTALLTACDLFTSAQPVDQPQPIAVPTAIQSKQNTPSVPAGACRARLWGKVTNATTGQAPANVIVEIAGGTLKGKTTTDANGLYGFDGLCSGEYTFTVTPPNGKPQPGPKASTDGTKQVKVDLSFK